MKIYLINLDRAEDRRKHMMDELSRYLPDVLVERAMCLDIKRPDWSVPDFITPGRWKSDRWSLGPSDIEIFRSHLDCWEKIAKSGEVGIVLEDDLLFAADFADGVKKVDVNKLHGILRLDGLNRPILLEKPIAIFGNFTVSPVASIAASAAAYMLDPKTAAELAQTAVIERTVDDYLFDPTPDVRGARGHNFPVLQLEPVITVQAQFGTYSDRTRKVPSFLENTKRVDVHKRKDKAFTGPLLYRLRKEVMRFKYKKQLKQRIEQNKSAGGRWGSPDLCPDLIWE